MTARLSFRLIRIIASLVGAGALLAIALPGRATASDQAAPANPVNLTGEGTWDIDQTQLTGWENDLYGSAADPKISLRYIQQGGPTGLSALLNGSVDYAISGIPYTKSQLDGFPGGANGIIAAPIMPSAVGFLLNAPSFQVFDYTTSVGASYTGQVRVPADNLMAQLFNYKATDDPVSASSPYYPVNCVAGGVQYNEWDDPDIISNWDQSFLAQYDPSSSTDFVVFNPCGPFPGGNSGVPITIFQAAPSEWTYYLEQWASVAGPAMWSLLQKNADPTPAAADPWAPSAQVVPNLQRNMGFAPGFPEALPNFDQYTNGAGESGLYGGVEMPSPPSGLKQAVAQAQVLGGTSSSSNLQWIYVQNANGDWVAPSPASIDTAVDATPAVDPMATSGEQALDAASNHVPGAYPLTYIDYLYAPASGLSPQTTEALATMIRYLVTDGQNSMASYNDGELSSGLVLQALNAANRLVKSNCPPADLAYTAALGPYTPTNLPGLDGLGTEYHCEVAASTPSSGTTPTTTPTKSNMSSPPPKTTSSTTASGSTSGSALAGGSTGGMSTKGTAGLSSSSGSGSAATGTGSFQPVGAALRAGIGRRAGSAAAPAAQPATGEAKTAGASKKTAKAYLASNLPFSPLSGTGARLDKLVALMVGVWLFLLVRRRPVDWIRRTLGG